MDGRTRSFCSLFLGTACTGSTWGVDAALGENGEKK